NGRRRPPAAGQPRCRPGAVAGAGTAARPACAMRLATAVVQPAPGLWRRWHTAAQYRCRLAAAGQGGAGAVAQSCRRSGLMEMNRTTPDLVRTMPWSDTLAADITPLLTREWLVTNGLGGYASG